MKTEKSDFDKCLKDVRLRPIPIDDYYRYPAFPIVLLLSKAKFIQPYQVVVFGFILKIIVCYQIASGQFVENNILTASLLFFAMLLDYVDGMLARLTDRVSEFGGLLDLAGDIISSIAIFVCIGVFLNYSSIFEIITLLISFAGFVLPMGIWSYIIWRKRRVVLKQKMNASEFLDLKISDKSTCFETAVRKLYNLTWRNFTVIAFRVFDIENVNVTDAVLKAFAFACIGINLTALCVMILLRVDLVAYLYYQVAQFGVLYFVALANRNLSG